MSWQLDEGSRDLQKKFALVWFGLTILAIWWFLDRSWGMSDSDLGWLGRRLEIIQNIVVISGVSFGVVFFALLGLGAFINHRRQQNR